MATPMPIHKCGTATALISGRTLRQALQVRRIQHRTIPLTEWVQVCPRCDRDLLRSRLGTPLPFLASDGVMRTAAEYHGINQGLSAPLRFARFMMSSSALNSAFALFDESDPTTAEVEAAGRAFAQAPTPDSAFRFSEAVCKWGRGQRVWANLRRHNGDDQLSKRLSAWLNEAIACNDAERVMLQGLTIKGLGVSFASKHLRMLAPERFPVLDQVLSEGLGFALNPKGYSLFQFMLQSFQEEISTLGHIAQFEGALFLLVRQHVRSTFDEDDA